MKLREWSMIAAVFIMTAIMMVSLLQRSDNGAIVKPDSFQLDLVSALEMEKIQQILKEQQIQKERENQYITDIINSMTLEEKLAQMMILTNEKDITEEMMKKYQPGGIIFFGKDFSGKTADQVKERVERLQSGMKIPLLIGVDEEGGEVSRIAGMKGEKIPVFQSARDLYDTGGIEAVSRETKKKADFLKEMGINLNFDPVADVVNNRNAYMYERAAAGEAEQVAEYVETVVTVSQKENIGCCLKHFPGYGENINTHTDYAIDGKSLSFYRNRDFIPFQRGVEAGADMVMVSHIVMKAVDDKQPASLSLKVHNLLRDEIGFDKVIIADDLNMKAVLNHMTLEKAVKDAFLAGNDMIFSADLEVSMDGARQAVQEGILSERQIEESVARILKMKKAHGWIMSGE